MTWQRAKLKFTARFGYGDALPTDEVQEGPFRVFGSNGPYASFSRSNTGAPAIVVGRKGSYGKVNWTSEPCFSSDTTFFIDSSTSRHDLRWVYWLLQTLRLDEGTDETAIPGLNRETAYDKEVSVPPARLQRAIADYLDRETARLDGLMTAKERLLGLLAEKRRALITRAVTRGLDPRVPLRDSGIPWLGEIPAHWEIRRLRFFCYSIQTGSTPSQEFMDSLEEDAEAMDWFTPGDFTGLMELWDSNRKVSVEAGRLAKVSVFAAGTVFVVGIGATLGKVGFIRRSASANQQINAVVPRPDIDGELLAWTLSTLADVMNAIANSATLPILNQQRLGDIQVALPLAAAEQRAIVAYIEKETARLDAMRSATERTIALLKERRAALIAAAVTGKIDVCEATA